MYVHIKSSEGLNLLRQESNLRFWDASAMLLPQCTYITYTVILQIYHTRTARIISQYNKLYNM